MKRIRLIMVTLIFALMGCASVEKDNENAEIPADDAPISAAKNGEGAVLPLSYETLTKPPVLAVSTLNNADRIIASCGNSEWNYTLPDDMTATICACGAHPLDNQEHPVLYTAFSAGSLPSLEDGADNGAIVPALYLDFGEILPESLSAVRWPASCIGSTQNYTDFEEVTAEKEGDTITLLPLGDGDYVYEVTARWGEAGYASYTFRTLPQIRGEQTGVLTGIFDVLSELEYQPYTCDGLPEYCLTAADGTVYAVNFSEKWVWRGNSEQAELSDELIGLLKENPDLVLSDQPLEIP